jgi:hypothetical protein
LEYEDTAQKHTDANGIMKRIAGVLFATARLAGGTLASVGKGPGWTLTVQNAEETRRIILQLLKGRQLCSAVYEDGVYTEVLHDLMAVLKDSSAKGGTAKTTIIAYPSVGEFHEQTKAEPTDDDNK